MKQILLEEQQEIRIAKGVCGPGEITSRQLERLVANWQATTGQDPGKAFEYSQGLVRPTNWMGSVLAGDILVEVVPRGALALDGQERQRLDRNVGEMLHVALGSEPLRVGAGPSSPSGSRFEKAVEALCELVVAARRKRVLRRYRMREEVTRAPRGNLRFPAQAVVPLQNPGLTASRWVELSEDTAENRFLKSVLSLSARRVGGGGLRRRAEEALIAFENAGDPSDPLLEYKRIQFNRLPAEYVELIELAKSILDGGAAGILAGSMSGRSEVLFMPALFQAFVSRMVRDFAASRGLTAELEARGRRLGRWDSGPFTGEELIEVLPDAELREPPAPQPVAILDAKWKKIRSDVPSLNVSSDDMHQMVAYSVGLGCGRMALVYPWLERRSPFPQAPVLQVGSPPMRLMVVAVPLLWARLKDVVSEFEDALERLLGL